MVYTSADGTVQDQVEWREKPVNLTGETSGFGSKVIIESDDHIQVGYRLAAHVGAPKERGSRQR